jgi:hypothetical protein
MLLEVAIEFMSCARLNIIFMEHILGKLLNTNNFDLPKKFSPMSQKRPFGSEILWILGEML